MIHDISALKIGINSEHGFNSQGKWQEVNLVFTYNKNSLICVRDIHFENEQDLNEFAAFKPFRRCKLEQKIQHAPLFSGQLGDLMSYNKKTKMLHGMQERFHPNGILKVKFNTKSNLLDGDLVAYHDNGALHKQGRFHEERQIGFYKEYDKNERITYWSYVQNRADRKKIGRKIKLTKGYDEQSYMKFVSKNLKKIYLTEPLSPLN